MISVKNRQILQGLYLAKQRRDFPSVPDHCRASHAFSDATANGLEKTIIFYLNETGCQAERIKNQGRFLEAPKIYHEFYQREVSVGKGKYIPGTGSNGTSDIAATVHGRAFKIEVKIGKDRQSDAQREYERRTTMAGGIYMIAKTFDQFLEDFKALTSQTVLL